ncbi:hypothetical protein [Winogradskyella sp.]|uniref:hypothetical protein n=1 Tax=Winogradskyella sp. TaxID=1883156 RepID=UPI002630ABE2|nr:hypothetical protein [Winogradskyella sp.]
MNHIIIQSGTNPNTPWASDFIALGNAWENYAMANNLKISGLIHPYGISCNLTGTINDFKTVEISITKKMENVTTGVIPQTSPYSSIIKMKARTMGLRTGDRLEIRKNSFTNRLLGQLNGLAVIKKTEELIIYSNRTKRDAKPFFDDLEALSDLDWLKVKNGEVMVRALKIPSETKQVESWFQTLNKIVFW